MRNTARVLLLAILAAAWLPAVTRQEYRRSWNELLVLQVRNQAVRHGVDMTRVTLDFDVRNHRASISGSVGTPWEKKLLREVVIAAGIADPEKINDTVAVRFYPEQWRRLRSHIEDARLSRGARARTDELLRQYERLVAEYNRMMPAQRSNRNQVRRRLTRLVEQLTDIELQLEQSGVFWMDETVRQLQEYRERKNALRTAAPAPAVTGQPADTATVATQHLTATEAP
jgi:hypothetical protein